MALKKLLDSVTSQEEYPNQIIIVDGSPDNATKVALKENYYKNIEYYKVEKEDRGLTRQRNVGISKLSSEINIVCFLDDDIILISNYFKELLKTYKSFPNAVGVGGYIKNETLWNRTSNEPAFGEFKMDGWIRKIGSRNVIRKKMGLLSDQPPGYMPTFSNVLSIGFLPPTGKTYPVEFFMGGVASYRVELLKEIKFSSYFEGYGLYEDMDFCLRASKIGSLYVNTAAQLYHYHEAEGRPNKFEYGKMVLRNGWYVWRVKYPHPQFSAKLKWHGIAFLLTLIRLGNSLTTKEKKEAITESIGRFVGWWSLLWNKPKINRN